MFIKLLTLLSLFSSVAYAVDDHMENFVNKPSVTIIELAPRINDVTNVDGPVFISKSDSMIKFIEEVRKEALADRYKKSKTVFINDYEKFDFNQNYNFEDKNVIVLSPLWAVSQETKIETKGCFYGFGDQERRNGNQKLKIKARNINLSNIGYYGVLELEALNIAIRGNSKIGNELSVYGNFLVEQAKEVSTDNLKVKGSLTNYGCIKSLFNMDVDGETIVNGKSNDIMGAIMGSKISLNLVKDLDNRFGKIIAQNDLSCHVDGKIMCGDKVSKEVPEKDKNNRNALGVAYSGTQICLKYANGYYYVSNNALIKSSSVLTLKAGSIDLNYGNFWAGGIMELLAPLGNIYIKAGVIQGLQDVKIETQNLTLTREDVMKTQVGWTSSCYHNDYSDRRMSGPSKIQSLKSVIFKVSRAEVRGSFIYANNDFKNHLTKNIDPNKENFFKITPYQGQFWGTNGYRHACIYSFTDNSEIKAGNNIEIEVMGGDLIFNGNNFNNNSNAQNVNALVERIVVAQNPIFKLEPNVKTEPTVATESRDKKQKSQPQNSRDQEDNKETYIKGGYVYTKQKVRDLSEEPAFEKKRK